MGREKSDLVNPLDIVMSFDTTGSMYSVLATVRRDMQKVAKELFKQFNGKLRIAVIAHGDYCDANETYVVRALDFTDDVSKICEFIRDTESTYGGDADECYELVLNTVRTKMSWSGGSQKIFMMIGDSNPHDTNYPMNTEHIDWMNEAKLLNDMNIKVYAVHALSNIRRTSKKFYQTVANETNGCYLTLDNFNEVLDLVSATCYQQYGANAFNDYVEIIKSEKRMTRTLAENFDRLTGDFVEFTEEDTYEETKKSHRRRGGKGVLSSSFKEIEGLQAIPSGRFQVIDVDETMPLKNFVEKNGIKFKSGRAFYELKKTEEIQQYKEIILQNKESGDFYYGSDVRKKLGLLPQCNRSEDYVTEKIRPNKNDEYKVFVQSTSYNRKLPAGTNILYEIEDC